ncbi:trans-AT polyketide synthase/acyltransferase/oxidoreductase domain-containing protein [Saccharothrix tamanrassetensis]|uniref:[acyl-carrier-protein] S-malonyltransferase n=1 Tax=Saccharothrix tamanrassetensis TaxID=1051531 RepID=A0A841C8P2_9PSEU|nr:ACP S-malonyltransferase [Saccharothrix tamanrassetensis]MBB5953779.1 trans-AT polyketide synthase/acyltransferase/oxidoreductase domain-containing protein [Saccharothrix tamanrassetensis]
MTRAWLFPGQGSQHPDMGAELFARFPDQVAQADRIIGVPLRDLCRDTAGTYLNQTRYVQPAVFTVSALAARAALESGTPDVLAGHSLGEYAALHVAGCLDFETALRLVVRRGELMGAATGGGMLAVLGLPLERVEAVLASVDGVDLANHNLPDQVVLAGTTEGVRSVIEAVRAGGTGRCVPLAVSIAAHSRFMATAAAEFAEVLRGVRFAEPRIPVISNVTAQPHDLAGLPELLHRHFTRPVRWWDTLCHLARTGVTEITEIGPGEVLTKMWHRAAPRLPAPEPVPVAARRLASHRDATPPTATHRSATMPTATHHAATPPTATRPVATVPTATLLAATVPTATDHAVTPPTAPKQAATPSSAIRHSPPPQPATAPPARSGTAPDPGRLGSPAFRAGYGVRLACLAGSLDHGVTSPALLRRLSDAGQLGFHGTRGLGLAEVRAVLADLRGTRFGMAWIDDPDIADLYLAHDVRHVEVTDRQAGPHLLRFRFDRGERQVLLRTDDPNTAAKFLRDRVATDIAVEEDSALPAIAAIRDALAPGVRIGRAGVGTPEAVAAAFVLGADFVLTTSVNQCTPEAATSDAAKDLLADLDVTDTRPAPDADLFELGGRSRVVRKGSLFAARAEQLYRLYVKHDRLEDLPARTREEVERNHFGRSLEQVWAESASTARDAKHRMALVFAAYCREATAAALNGATPQRLNYRVPSGPDMGAFNRFTAGGALRDWRRRNADVLAEELMGGAADRLGRLRPLS